MNISAIINTTMILHYIYIYYNYIYIIYYIYNINIYIYYLYYIYSVKRQPTTDIPSIMIPSVSLASPARLGAKKNRGVATSVIGRQKKTSSGD
jgi:hypothetical protein